MTGSRPEQHECVSACSVPFFFVLVFVGSSRPIDAGRRGRRQRRAGVSHVEKASSCWCPEPLQVRPDRAAKRQLAAAGSTAPSAKQRHPSGTHRRRLPKKNGFGSIMSPSAAAVRRSEATGGTDELDGSQTGHGETDARLEWTATARPRGGVPRQGRMQIARCDRRGIMFAEKFFAENAYNTAALEFSRSRVQVPRGESVSASGNAAVDTW